MCLAGLGHNKALCPMAPRRFISQLSCSAGRYLLQTTQYSWDTESQQTSPTLFTASQKTPKSLNQLKRILSWETLQRGTWRQSQPSFHGRSLLLACGSTCTWEQERREGLQYRKLTAGHPVSPQHDYTGNKPGASYFITGSHQPGVQAPEQNNANFTSYHWPQGEKEASAVLQPELTPGMGTTLQHEPQQHCQLLQPFGKGCPAASRDGGTGGGHSCWVDGFSSGQKSQGKNP